MTCCCPLCCPSSYCYSLSSFCCAHVQGLDNNTGPEKIRVIYETTFRPVQGDRPGAGPSLSSISPKPRQATVTAQAVPTTGTSVAAHARSLKGSMPQSGPCFGGNGMRLRGRCMQKPSKWRSAVGRGRGHVLSSAVRSVFVAR